jgi:phenylpropionate dioxygenase-like ring-hydroxylating dioxygenase large terminal subunit
VRPHRVPLFTGTLEGHTLTCPCHDWRFDVRTGRFLEAPELGLAVYPTKSELVFRLFNEGVAERIPEDGAPRPSRRRGAGGMLTLRR